MSENDTVGNYEDVEAVARKDRGSSHLLFCAQEDNTAPKNSNRHKRFCEIFQVSPRPVEIER